MIALLSWISNGNHPGTRVGQMDGEQELPQNLLPKLGTRLHWLCLQIGRMLVDFLPLFHAAATVTGSHFSQEWEQRQSRNAALVVFLTYYTLDVQNPDMAN